MHLYFVFRIFLGLIHLKCEELNIPFDGKLNPSDLRYYLNLREQKEFSVDQAKLQEYFPLQVVIDGTFKIYQVFLNRKIIR